jgi:hypothetical protein
MRKLLWIVPLFALLLTPVIANAQFEKGNLDLTLSGAGNSDKDFKDGSFNLNASLGVFASDEVEFSVRQSVSYNDGFTGVTFVAADLFLSKGTLVPFVGVNAGVSYGEGQDPGYLAGPEIGLRYFVSSSTYVQAIAQYEFDLKEGIEDGQFLYGVGLGFRW